MHLTLFANPVPMSKRLLIFGGLALLLWVLSSNSDVTEIAAGVAIFLFGMIALEEGFQAFTGGALENVLRASTDRLWKSLSFGLITTAIVQSSSLVSILSITFLSAGLIDLTTAVDSLTASANTSITIVETDAILLNNVASTNGSIILKGPNEQSNRNIQPGTGSIPINRRGCTFGST